MYYNFDISEQVIRASERALEKAKCSFEEIDRITEQNQIKVLSAFTEFGISESHFAETTGYGYGDRGRETIDKLFAKCVGAEDSLVRHNFTCGTHTLAVALFGVLRPGDTMLSVTGTPYDTIHSVIGLTNEAGQGSLKDFGVNYMQVDLNEEGRPDMPRIEKVLKENDIKMVYIQRSRGYSLRPTLSVNEIKEIVELTHSCSNAMVMVDNCYGEFTEIIEPGDVGCDLFAGSLIKNAGGGLARTGGYIAGKSEFVELCSYRMTTPGLGREVGATLNQSRNLYMGLFNAPHVVGEALKAAAFTAALFKEFGFGVTPEINETRHDIIQAVKLEKEENLIAFCQGLQKGAPVDSTAVPEPWEMPGYDSKVIMSAGAFISGASIELSADAPLREPFAVWMQGGLNFHSAKLGIMLAAEEMNKRGLLDGRII